MGHYFNVLIRMINDPWTLYFAALLTVCAVVYVFGDRWKKK